MPPILTSLVFAAVGVLLMALAIPPMRRRVPPNATYGLRVRATFADPDVWYEANAASGRDLFGLGAALLVAALVVPWVAGRWAPPLLTGGAVIGALAMARRGTRHANRLLAERQRGARDSDRAPTG